MGPESMLFQIPLAKEDPGLKNCSKFARGEVEIERAEIFAPRSGLSGRQRSLPNKWLHAPHCSQPMDSGWSPWMDGRRQDASGERL
jgi:hypothetical protein